MDYLQVVQDFVRTPIEALLQSVETLGNRIRWTPPPPILSLRNQALAFYINRLTTPPTVHGVDLPPHCASALGWLR